MNNPLISIDINNRCIARVAQIFPGEIPTCDVRLDASIEELTAALHHAMGLLLRADRPWLFGNVHHGHSIDMHEPPKVILDKRFGTDLKFLRRPSRDR